MRNIHEEEKKVSNKTRENMQVRQVNTVNSQRQLKHNNDNKIQQNINNSKQQSQSFKGGLDTFCLGLANTIENGGLFVSFTLQDMLGTNLPRPIMEMQKKTKANQIKALLQKNL